MNGNDTFLDVNDAHLRVTSGNVYASAFNLDQIDIVMSSNTASTVNFNNPTKAFNAASNIEVGTANLFVDTTTTRVGVGTASPATTLDVAGDLNVSGNLTIIGTTTTLDTEHLTVKDPIIELGKGNTASPVVDLGLVMTRPSGSSNVGIIFDESAGRLEIGYTQGSASDSTITMDSAPLSVNVNGTIAGNGSGLTALNAANVTTGTLAVTRGGTGTTTSTGTGSIVLSNAPEFIGDSAFLHGGSGTPHNSNDLTLRLGGVNLSGSIIQSKCAIVSSPSTSYGGAGQYGRNALHFCVGPDAQNDTNASKTDSRMCIDYTGNVGIGTTSPAKKLHVEHYGSAIGDFEGIRIANHASLLHATSRPAYEFVVSDIAAGTGIGASKFAIGYRGTTSASRTDRLVIDNSGNVGIGIDSPSRTLDVSTTGSIGFGNNVGASAERGLYWSNDADYAIYRTDGNWSSPNYQQLLLNWSTGIVLQTARGTYGRSHVGVDDRMSIGASYYATKSPTNGLIVEGNVGIGTSNPTSAKLHVLGSATISLNARYYNVNGDSANANTNRPLSGYFGSHLACAELQVFSDRRIKTEIEDIDDGSALELFRQIQPKTYEYLDKVEKGNKRVYGFIAQEIKELIPEAVDVSTGKIPNIYEVANVSNSNVITFTHFNTSNLESNSNIIEVQTIHNKSESLNIIEVIDEHTIRVEEDLSEWIGSVDESGNVTTGNELFVYGQEVNDFHHLKKSAIFTVTTAALQEVDRQLQDTKAQLATVLARLDALESA